MTAPQDLVSIAKAARLIGTDDSPLDPKTVRCAAQRIGVVVRDASGRAAIRPDIVDLFKRNYRLTGFLCRRGQRSVEQAVA
jgi:hypothetical protein